MPPGESTAAYEFAHVLFIDIVAYSLQPIDRQTELLTLLQKIVRESPEFERARDQKELISLPTGDGMALVFLRDPLSPVKCALEIADSLARHPQLRIRMGIHTGPVQRHDDIREASNVVGGGINMAQRVMDCGDAGHILLSRNVAEVLEQFSDWRGCLRSLGSHEVKHGVSVQLYNLVKNGAGNPLIPGKLMADDDAARRSEMIRHAILFAGMFLLAWVLTMFAEQWLDRGIASGDSASIAQATFIFSGLYQRIVAAPRDTVPSYTAVVEIDPERDPGSVSLYDRCGQRKMMAVLLRRIAAAQPRAIVIDKYYGESNCPGTINRDLIAAISEVNAQHPVVVGRFLEKGLYLQASLFKELPELHDAIVNIDRDTRKLPLKWYVYGTKAGMDRDAGRAWRETLALEAAEVSEKGELARRHPRLAALLDPVRNPYISFLNKDKFKPMLAGFVLCGRDVKPGEDALACPESSGALGDLHDKIVLIGEIRPEQDTQLTVVGKLPGVYLQANFIEALLGERYYETRGDLDYVFALLFLAGVEAILMRFRDWVMRLGAIGLLTLAMLFLLYMVITSFHWYVNPLPFIALALLVRALATNLPYFRKALPAR